MSITQSLGEKIVLQMAPMLRAHMVRLQKSACDTYIISFSITRTSQIWRRLSWSTKWPTIFPWIADSEHWKKSEYWATPLETITTFGGDCEDIAFVKWVILNSLGITSEHLALAYVKIKVTGEDHMVLLYLAKPDAPAGEMEAYVLDNYRDEVKKGAERTDLLAILGFNASGDVALIADNGSERTIKAEYKERKIKKLEDLKKRIRENREALKKINDGSPLLPEV